MPPHRFALLLALVVASAPSHLALEDRVSSPTTPQGEQQGASDSRGVSRPAAPGGNGVWTGWGPGFDIDDGPRIAEATTANRTHAAASDPEAAAFTDGEMNPPVGGERVVSTWEQTRKQEKLRTVKIKAPEGEYYGVNPIFPMGSDVDEKAPKTVEEWVRRSVAPAHPIPLRGGWRRPPRGTLSWSHAARAAVMSEIRRLQFPPSCDDAKILAFPVEMCPLGCRMHIFLQRALITSVALGRTLVPLPPWNMGFDHLFQPITNCSLTEGRPGARSHARIDLGKALEKLSDMFLASGAPHEKLHPLEQSHHLVMMDESDMDEHMLSEREKYLKGRETGSLETVAEVWFDMMESLLREQSADAWMDGNGGWEQKKRDLKEPVITLARVIVGDGEEMRDVIICTNGRCDGVYGLPGACVRPEGCHGGGIDDQMPQVLWKLMREKHNGLRFVGHPGGPGHRGRGGMQLGDGGRIGPEPIVFFLDKSMKARMMNGMSEMDRQRVDNLLESNTLVRGHFLPMPGYPVPNAVGVPMEPPRIPDYNDLGEFGCNDWPSACQPHFMLHSMLTSWMLTRPLTAVAELISPEIFHNLNAIRHPVATLQVRRTDKRGEDPFFHLYGGYRDLKEYIRTLGQVAMATGKCFRTLVLMTDAKHAVLALRRMHHKGLVKICGRKPVLVFSRGIADGKEHNVPVFGDSLRGRGGRFSKATALKRERLFVAELWLAARHSDFVLGDANSNVFNILLESIAARKRVADLPKLVAWDHASFKPSGGGGGSSSVVDRDGGGNTRGDIGGVNETGRGRGGTLHATAASCPNFDPLLNRCLWISSIGASFQMGWHSVLKNNPWVNGEPRIAEYAFRLSHENDNVSPILTKGWDE